MNALLVDTRRKWCMLSSELHSVRSLRRFPSVGTEYAAVVSRASVAQQYPYIGSCINVRQTCTRSFSVVRFTQLKKKCLQKLTSLAVDEVCYYSYFIHDCGHSHTLTIATGGARTCNKPVMSRRSWESTRFCKHFFFSCVKLTTLKLLVQVRLTYMQEPMYGYC